MNIGEILLKDIFPKKVREILQLSAGTRLRIGSIVMTGAVLWFLAAPWLSANNKITVSRELSSHWLVACAFLYGAGNFVQYARFHLLGRLAVAGLLGAVLLTLWFESHREFFFWKARSLRPEDWSEAISYLQNIEKDQTVGKPYRALPIAVRRLGLAQDFDGESGRYVNFGYRIRTWGVFRGTEETLDDYCPGCLRVRVGEGVYFYVGARG